MQAFTNLTLAIAAASTLVILSACASEEKSVSVARQDEVQEVSADVSEPSYKQATAAQSPTSSDIVSTRSATIEDSATTQTLPEEANPTTSAISLAGAGDTTSTVASAATTTSTQGRDVGYEGLTRSIGNIERNLAPYFADRTARISPDVAAQIRKQTSIYVTEIKDAASVDKELRLEIRDLAIDIGSAVDEMSKLPPGERYETLRSLTQRRVEEIQAEIMGSTPGSSRE